MSSLLNKTYVDGVATPLTEAYGWRWDTGANWVDGVVPASAPNVAAVLRNTVATTAEQRIYMRGTEIRPGGTYTNTTSLGHLTARCEAGTSVLYTLTADTTYTNGSYGQAPLNQIIRLRTTDGTSPRITVGANTTLNLKKETVLSSVGTLGAPYYYQFGVSIYAEQLIVKDGPGTLVLTKNQSTYTPNGFQIAEGSVQVHALEGELLSPLTMTSSGRFLQYSEGVTGTTIPTYSSLTGTGVYELDLAPQLSTQSSSAGTVQDVAPAPIALPTTGNSTLFAGTVRLTSGLLTLNEYQYSIMGFTACEIKQDSGLRLAWRRSASGTTTISKVISGEGIFEVVALTGFNEFRFQPGTLSGFGGAFLLARGRLIMGSEAASAFAYTGAPVPAYNGRFSAYTFPPGYALADRSLQLASWTGWPAGTAASVANTSTRFNPRANRGDIVLGATAILVIEGTNVTVAPGRRIVIPAKFNSPTGAAIYPGGTGAFLNNAYQGLLAEGVGSVTFNASVVLEKTSGLPTAYVLRSSTVVTQLPGANGIALEGSAADLALAGCIAFTGEPAEPLNMTYSGRGGHLKVSGIVKNLNWNLLQGFSLSLEADCVTQGVNAAGASVATKPTVTNGTVNVYSPAAWGTATPLLATHQSTSHAARFRFWSQLSEAQDIDITTTAQLGVGTTYWESYGSKAVKLRLPAPTATTGSVLQVLPTGTSTVPATGFRLVLGGSSTADNTIDSFITDDVALARRFPTAGIPIRKLTIEKQNTGSWTFRGDCPITADVTVAYGTIKVDSPDGTAKLSSTLNTNTLRVQANGTVKTLTGTTQKGRHTYEGNVSLDGGVLHIGGT